MSLVEQTLDLRHAESVRAAYSDFGAPLFRFALRMLRDRGAAEEAVQETFVRAWRAADRYDIEQASLQRWLFAICRNVAIDMTRARKIRPALANGSRPIVSRQFVDVEEIDVVIRGWTLEEALRRLSPEHRQAVMEVLVLDRPQDAVAAELGVPVGTIKSRLYYGLRTLRNVLDEMGWDQR